LYERERSAGANQLRQFFSQLDTRALHRREIYRFQSTYIDLLWRSSCQEQDKFSLIVIFLLF